METTYQRYMERSSSVQLTYPREDLGLMYRWNGSPEGIDVCMVIDGMTSGRIDLIPLNTQLADIASDQYYGYTFETIKGVFQEQCDEHAEKWRNRYRGDSGE